MKRLVIRWIVGYGENNEPIYKRQALTVDDIFNLTDAQTVLSTLDKYSNYTCESAQLVINQSVGDIQ
ncbi:MAG: hypothetical protein ACP5PP_00910 [Fervidobacterium sp.]